MVVDMYEARLNTHQTHLESLVIEGSSGLDEIESYLTKFMRSLQNVDSELNITTKIDGAPAVFVGHNVEGYPESFVGIKSVLNNPSNAYSTIEEVNEYVDKAEAKSGVAGSRLTMRNMLQYALELAKSIPDGQIWQGDCLFDTNSKKERNIRGVDYITFQPNKVMYCYSEDNAGYEQVKNADFGIAFHTVYTKSGDGWNQSFRIDASQIDAPDNFYIMSPVLNYSRNKEDYDLTYLESEMSLFDSLKQELISDPNYFDLTANENFNKFWSQFENNNISDKKRTTLDTETVIDDFRLFCSEKFQKASDSYKTEKSKAKVAQAKEDLDLLLDNVDTLNNIVETINCVADIKMSLLNTINKTKPDYSTFAVRGTDSGFDYEDTTGEGLAMSDQDGNIVKLVDRSSFSNINRDPSYLAGFQHESLQEASRKSTAKQLFLDPEHSKIRTFAIMTANNSDNIAMSRKENDKLNKEVIKNKLAFKGSMENFLDLSFMPYYKVPGHYAGNKEDSFIIYNIDLESAKGLAANAKQQSFVYGTNDAGNLTFEMYANRSKSGHDYIKVDTADAYIDATDFEDNYTKISKDFKFNIPFSQFEVGAEDMIESYDIDEDLLERSLDTKISGRGHLAARSTLWKHRREVRR